MRDRTFPQALVLGLAVALAGPALAVPHALAAPQTVAPVPTVRPAVVHAGTHTDTVAGAKARATALRRQVDALQLQAEQASEDYDAAQSALGIAVNQSLSAQEQLDAAGQRAQAQTKVSDASVRSLYMSGGLTGLYAGVLDSGSLSELTSGLHDVDQVLADQRDAAARTSAAIADQTDAQHRLAAAATRSTQLQTVVAQRGDAVRGLLAQSAALLTTADAQVRSLVLVQQQQAAAAAAAAARTRLSSVGLLTAPDVPASPRAAAALAFARAQLGKPYVWGATGPSSYDCSGLTGAAYAAAGLALPRTSREQWNAGPHVALADLQPGDLLFWATNTADPATIHHVALYAGQGLMIAAPHTGTVVQVQQVYLDGFIGAVRPDPSSVLPPTGPPALGDSTLTAGGP